MSISSGHGEPRKTGISGPRGAYLLASVSTKRENNAVGSGNKECLCDTF